MASDLQKDMIRPSYPVRKTATVPCSLRRSVSGGRLIWKTRGLTTQPLFGAFRQLLVGRRHLDHLAFGLRVGEPVCNRPRCLGPIAPILGRVDQTCHRSCPPTATIVKAMKF